MGKFFSYPAQTLLGRGSRHKLYEETVTGVLLLTAKRTFKAIRGKSVLLGLLFGKREGGFGSKKPGGFALGAFDYATFFLFALVEWLWVGIANLFGIAGASFEGNPRSGWEKIGKWEAGLLLALFILPFVILTIANFIANVIVRPVVAALLTVIAYPFVLTINAIAIAIHNHKKQQTKTTPDNEVVWRSTDAYANEKLIAEQMPAPAQKQSDITYPDLHEENKAFDAVKPSPSVMEVQMYEEEDWMRYSGLQKVSV